MKRLTLFALLALVAGVLVGQPPDLIESPIQSPIKKVVYPPVSPFTGEFSPADVDGLLVWAEADGTMTESGGSVSSWGEPGYTALTQGTGAKQPTYTADDGDGLPAVTFDGTDDVLIANSVTVDADGTWAVFFVGRGTATGTQMFFEFGESTETTGGFYMFKNSTVVSDGTLLQTHNGDPDATVDGTWHVWSSRYPEVATSSLVAFEDGIDLWDGYTTNQAADLGGTTDNFHVGGRGPTPSFPLVGGSRAVLVYSPIPSAAEITQIQDYLDAKWTP